MRGGKRSGAGRRKGAPNKATAARQAAISASGEAPLDYMIRIMRDESAPTERRDEICFRGSSHNHAARTQDPSQLTYLEISSKAEVPHGRSGLWWT